MGQLRHDHTPKHYRLLLVRGSGVRAPCGLAELAQQVVHPRNGVLDFVEHIALKVGVIDVLRIRHNQAELARQIFDVVDDKGEALGIVVQQFSVAQDLGRSSSAR